MMANMGKERVLDVVDPSEVVVVVLGGGRGTRLYPLTRDRAKPAVGFGGKYRIIDITLTNCLRSRLDRVFILTQFNSFSLNRHVWQTYSREVSRNGFVDIVAAEETNERRDWFQGTADAVRQSLRYILHHRPRYVLILSGDQLYSLDYRAVLLWHQTRHAHVTIAAHYATQDEINGLGILRVDDNLEVTAFAEKPQDPTLVETFRLGRGGPVKHPQDRPFLGSMGLYLFETPVLVDALSGNDADFGGGVIPALVGRVRMSCYPFDGYWRDVGTIPSFYQANMDWCAGRGLAELFHDGNPIVTHSRLLPPSRFGDGAVRSAIVADGCHLQAKSIARSIIGVRSRIGAGAVIEDSIIMGNDEPLRPGPPEIGAGCLIRRAIVDKNAAIGEGSVIENAEGVQEAHSELYTIRSGIVVIPRGTVLPPGTRI